MDIRLRSILRTASKLCDSRVFDSSIGELRHNFSGMILSYKDKKTEAKATSDFEPRPRSILPNILRVLPGNRLEALKGNRAGQYAIRINQQWRICFEWPASQPGPSNVESVDYHR